MPESISSCGELMAPPLSTTSKWAFTPYVAVPGVVVTRSGTGGLQLVIGGDSGGGQFAIQWASELGAGSGLTPWTTLRVVQAGSQPVTVEDPAAANARQRFYRVVPAP